MRLLACMMLCAAFASVSQAQLYGSIPANAKIYIDASSGFDTYLDTALRKKHVPLMITTQKNMADYEFQVLSAAQPIPGPDWLTLWLHGYGEANFRVINIRTRDVVFVAQLNRNEFLHDWGTAANACAMTLKAAVRRAESRIRTASPVLDF